MGGGSYPQGIAEGRLQILKLGVRELSCDERDAFFNLQSAFCNPLTPLSSSS
jgi:hypothetical protein